MIKIQTDDKTRLYCKQCDYLKNVMPQCLPGLHFGLQGGGGGHLFLSPFAQ
jgi:hypothetical protein